MTFLYPTSLNYKVISNKKTRLVLDRYILRKSLTKLSRVFGLQPPLWFINSKASRFNVPPSFDSSFLQGHAGGNDHRIPHSGKRRSITQIEIEQIIQGKPGMESGCRRVDAFCRSAAADYLNTEQSSRALLCQHFYTYRGGSRIIAGQGISLDQAD